MTLCKNAEVKDLLFAGINWDELPKARVTTVRERGWKCRIVTVSSAREVHLGHCLRKFLFRGLRKDIHVRDVISGNHRKAVQETVKPGKTGSILSADLTSATDLFPLDLVGALVDGLLAAKGNSVSTPIIPEVFHKLFRRLTGQQVLDWPELGKNATTSRGILMGLPTTWILLNLT